MVAPIALQLYTLRDALAQDFEGIVRKVADMGYVGVETAGLYGGGPQAGARLFTELGLQVCSAHMPLPLGDDQNKVLDTLAALDCRTLVVTYAPDRFESADAIKATCDLLNEGNAVASQNGLTLAYHNHWWEFITSAQFEGRTPFDLMLDQLDPAVKFELDTYWVKTGGGDPVQILQKHGARMPLLHIKDGPAVTDQPMVAVGDGVLDFPAIMEAAGDHPEWLIVELDECATDMLTAVEKSYTYLTQKGLARGNKS